MKRVFKGYLLIAVVCMVFGFGLSYQIKSVRYNAEKVGTEALRAEELQVLLSEKTKKYEELLSELLKYKDDLYKFRQEAEESGDYAKALVKQLEAAELLAGVSDVEGPGVIVVMEDGASAGGNSGISPSYFVIHDDDILSVLNELRDAGAEALSLNGERILATSEVRCSGSTVSVNNNRYSSPFVIKAIGDPDNLKNALEMTNGVVDVLKQWGIKVTIEKSDSLVIEAYGGVLSFKYARGKGKE